MPYQHMLYQPLSQMYGSDSETPKTDLTQAEQIEKINEHLAFRSSYKCPFNPGDVVVQKNTRSTIENGFSLSYRRPSIGEIAVVSRIYTGMGKLVESGTSDDKQCYRDMEITLIDPDGECISFPVNSIRFKLYNPSEE